MNNKGSLKILLIILLAIALILFIRWNSDLNKNNRNLSEKLLSFDPNTSGIGGELFTFDYDMAYAFDPYQSKEEMQKEIGFKSRILEQTVSEGMMNILFVKDDKPLAYLYGYGSNNGYYIDLSPGHYLKEDLDKRKFKVIENQVGNSSGSEKTYLNYIID